MKRALVVAATCIGIAAGAIQLAPTPAAAAASFSFGFGFGSPGPYPYHPGPFYPRPYYGAPYYHYPQAHKVCFPVVKRKKVVRNHRVHWRRVVVTVCEWRRG